MAKSLNLLILCRGKYSSTSLIRRWTQSGWTLELRPNQWNSRKGSGVWTAAMFHRTYPNIGPLHDHNASSPRVLNSRSGLRRVCPGMNKVDLCVHAARSDLGHVSFCVLLSALAPRTMLSREHIVHTVQLLLDGALCYSRCIRFLATKRPLTPWERERIAVSLAKITQVPDTSVSRQTRVLFLHLE